MPMRVLAVADVYEAVTSERPYRAAMSSEQALAILRAEVPARLDARRGRGARRACSAARAASMTRCAPTAVLGELAG